MARARQVAVIKKRTKTKANKQPAKRRKTKSGKA